MKILGIDASLTSTGLAWEQEGRIVTTRVLPGTRKGTPRLAYVMKILTQAVVSHNITHIALEGYSMGSHSGRFFSIGELGGCIKLFALNRNISILIVSPSSLKKFVAGNGGADKDMMIDAVNRRWDQEIHQNDEADAFGLLKICKAYYDPRKRGKYSANEIEALQNIEIDCKLTGD